ncbi:sulfite exporter TauE/SafE family protein [Horticoccus sp. 23ND18S-11]|uniref:sulfite exporter TauE/SafE family protein n=1 Tax=Horticoccus sp. 23ND18S-11 TaxID=3391832 RepID=UPI0039C92FF5
MELAAINSPGAAFIAGLITSLHCAGMCGPLACSLMPVRGDRSDAQTVSTVYHVSRLAGYAVLGGAAGAIGRAPLLFLSESWLRWLPWLLVFFFVALALRLDRYLPKVAALGRFTWKLQGWMQGRSRVQAAAAVGLATPLLPCGPLYFIVSLALLSGSTLRGVEVMLAFGLGTVPLLWLAQTQFHWVRRKLSPLWLGRVRITLALTTAAMISWRLRATLGFPGPDPLSLVCF